MFKRVNAYLISLSLVFCLVVLPARQTYAAESVGSQLHGIAVPTMGAAIGLLAALGFNSAQAGYQAYQDGIVKPLVRFLKGKEVADGKIRAYYQDGKTYIDKSTVTDAVKFLSDGGYFTNIKSNDSDLCLGEILDASSLMDAKSFFMSVPYFGQFTAKYPAFAENCYKYQGVPFYYYTKSGSTITYYFGLITARTYYAGSYSSPNSFKYFKISNMKNDSTSTVLGFSFLNDLYENVGSSSNMQFCGSVRVASDGVTYRTYSESSSNSLVYSSSSSYSEFGYKLGLSKPVVVQPSYTVAQPKIKDNPIDTWGKEWTAHAIDVLKDLKINTSIDVDTLKDAVAGAIEQALPLVLPQYGIEGTAESADTRLASLGYADARTGSVALSPAAVKELSEAIAKAAGEAIPNAGATDVPVTIPVEKYGSIDDYKLSLTSVFPFCIPFDLINLVKVFSATPEAPKFKFPVKYPTGQGYGTYELDIDLSSFDPVAKVVRILETALFILALIKITRSNMIRG